MRQCQAGRDAEQIADAAEVQLAQHVGEGLLAADDTMQPLQAAASWMPAGIQRVTVRPMTAARTAK
jgi:hypothetical protein